MSLQSKVAIVTGAGRGIGFNIAVALRQQGASVVLNDLEMTSAVARYLDEPENQGAAIFHKADISDILAIEQMIDRALERFGRLDILINNAAVDPTASLYDVDERFWDRVVDTNLKGAFFCSQRAARSMSERGQGRIVNISSVHSAATMPGYSVYCATKGALNAMTRELALELAPHGITVNAICPGAIEVEKFLDNPSYDAAALAKEIPAGRVGRPEDISSMVAFLCSDDAEWITGQVMNIDGGTLARLSLYVGRPVP